MEPALAPADETGVPVDLMFVDEASTAWAPMSKHGSRRWHQAPVTDSASGNDFLPTCFVEKDIAAILKLAATWQKLAKGAIETDLSGVARLWA